jgi:hypothetical protein
MRRRRYVIVVVAMAAVLAIGAATAAALRTPAAGPMSPETSTAAASPIAATSSTAALTPTATLLTEAQAVALVQAIDPTKSGLAVTGTQTLPTGPAFVVDSKDIHAIVDAGTGTIVSYLDSAAMASNATVAITPDEAVALATAYLRRHSISTDGLQPAVELMDHGDTKEYAVAWTGRVNGVRVPTKRDVSLDPVTGRVYAFAQYGRAFVAPPAPTLTEAMAVAAARALLRDPTAKVTASDVAIAFEAAGAQLLVYELNLTLTDGFVASVQVDAITGAATVTGRG